jgi:penicillin-binding protein 1C
MDCAAVKALFAVALVCAAAQASAVPSFDQVRAAHTPSDVPLLARDGRTVLATVRVDKAARRAAWVPVAEMSPALRHALLLSEDRRFWDHGGVDWQALAASAWSNAWNQRTRGASTLTMQLAGLLDEDLSRPAGGRSVLTKLQQMARAQDLERHWSKAQILEAYLNQVPLRGELLGVPAASQQLFGKHASGLDTQEAAILAAMVRAPNANGAALHKRACELLKQQAQGCEGLSLTLEQALARRPGPPLGEQVAPHLARLIANEAHTANPATAARGTTPRAFNSTLDAPLQRAASSALRRQLAELRGRNVEDGAVLVLDNASGEVLAYVGSAGAGSQAADVDFIQARRQPGSTLKPLLYALALQQRLITPASVLDDSPLQLQASGGAFNGGALYQPQNYDHAYRGAVNVRTALASSLNVPAVRVAAMLSPDTVFEGFNRAGLRLTETAGFHGHALALGSADVTLLDLTNAYRMLAQQGLLSPVRWQAVNEKRSGDTRRVLPEPVAWQVADMLADPTARATTFGLDSPLVTRGFAAVKTGTSKDLRDNWCVGFTSRYTVGVWVGNASGEPMQAVSGVTGAAPVWREVVALLHAREPSRAPPPPAGLVAQGGEWFLAGTEPGLLKPVSSPAAAAFPAFGIQSPRDGTVLVLDPEIPARAQHLVFEGAAGQWLLDGRVVGTGTRVHWLPRPGRHVLERRSAEGLDRVSFEVRAAPPPTTRPSAVRKQSG